MTSNNSPEDPKSHEDEGIFTFLSDTAWDWKHSWSSLWAELGPVRNIVALLFVALVAFVVGCWSRVIKPVFSQLGEDIAWIAQRWVAWMYGCKPYTVCGLKPDGGIFREFVWARCQEDAQIKAVALLSGAPDPDGGDDWYGLRWFVRSGYRVLAVFFKHQHVYITPDVTKSLVDSDARVDVHDELAKVSAELAAARKRIAKLEKAAPSETPVTAERVEPSDEGLTVLYSEELTKRAKKVAKPIRGKYLGFKLKAPVEDQKLVVLVQPTGSDEIEEHEVNF